MGSAIESLEQRQLLTFAIDLFADINQYGVASDIAEFVAVGNEAFFVADDGSTGTELWRTDGTEGGTVLVKDIIPGPQTSDPRDLTVVDGVLYFTALDEENEIDLWKSDGTESGTVEVFDADAAGVYYLTDLTSSGGKLFFTAYEQATGYELWASDGTSSGTTIVKDINPDQLVIDGPKELTDVNGTLFFTSYDDGYYNRELWKSDGTAAGTVMVADLGVDPGDDPVDPLDDDLTFSSNPSYLANIGGVLYFAADDFEDGIELFKSDGTELGTVMVGEVNTAGSSDPFDLTEFDGKVFFSANNGQGERHLYESDGTTISLVADTTDGKGSSNPINFAVVGDDLFFSANGVKPATSIIAATPTLTATNSSLSGSRAGIIGSTFSAYQGQLTGFNASPVNLTAQSQDGTDDGPGWAGPPPTEAIPNPTSSARIGEAGVGLQSIEVGDLYIEDIDPADLDDDFWDWTLSDAAGLTNISFGGFASGNEFNTSTVGDAEGLLFELFVNDEIVPTSSTTVFGDDLDNWFAGRDANNISLAHPGGALVTSVTVRLSIGNDTFANFPDGGNEALVINAALTADLAPATTATEEAGRELHKTDGTTNGTTLVKDIVSQGSSNPFQLTEIGGKLFFAADDVVGDGLELWTSDGTESGTIQLVDSRPGTDAYGAPLDGAPEILGGLGSELFFTTSDPGGDRELWFSDGTPVNTEQLANINEQTRDSEITDLTPIGNNLYFIANNGVNGDAIWKADTVGGNATLHLDVAPAIASSVTGLTLFSTSNDQVVFYENSTGMSGAVFITNASGGQTKLFDGRPEPFNEKEDLFLVVNNQILFVADDGINGLELWRTDGSSMATMVDANFVSGAAGSNPAQLVNFFGNVFFASDSTSSGRELFYWDGFSILPAGFNEIQPGADSSSPEDLTVSGNQLYFTADDGTSGRELWRLQTNQFTQVADLKLGADGSNPSGLVDIGGALYFSADADDGTDPGDVGREPHRADGGNVVLIDDIDSGTSSSDPYGFMEFDGYVYFSADDGDSGRELWRTNVSQAGSGTTELVSDVHVGVLGSDPDALQVIDDRLLFNAASGSSTNRELWSTDGTDAKTYLVEDLFPPEVFGSDPREFTQIGDRYFFAAADGDVGRELFVLEEVEPSVSEVIIGGSVGAPVAEVQRSSVGVVTLVFEGLVEVPGGAIQLVNLDTDTTLTSLLVATRFEDNRTYVELTFGSGPSVVDRDPGGTTGLLNTLADGNYQLTIGSAQVMSPVSGQVMNTEYNFGVQEIDGFFRHFGDFDGDRDVDAGDLLEFGKAFRKSLGDADYDDAFDFDGDGDVDTQDYGRLRRRLGRQL